MNRSRIGRLALAGLAILAALYVTWFLGAEPEPSASDERPPRRVITAEVTDSEPAQPLVFSTVTRARRRAHVAFTLRGRLRERPVEVGQRVRRGELLARLDEREPTLAADAAAAAQAEAASRRAQAELDQKRVARLVEARAATAEELEHADAALAAARAAEDSAAARARDGRRRVGETRLTAPFDATVTEVLVEPGEMVQPGQPVAGLAGDDGVELEIEVPESVIGSVATGNRVTVALPLAGLPSVEGEVVSVGLAAVGAGRLFPIVIAVPDGAVRAGMTAEVHLERAAKAALSVPVEAVINPGGRRPAVFRVRDGHAEKVAIEVDALTGDRVTVRGDLVAGDRVVVGGQHGLLDGEPVETAR